MNLRTLYLILAVAGAIVPYAFFVSHWSDAGFGIVAFIGALFVNPVAGGFTADLVISSLVFWIWMFQRRSREGGPNPALFVILNLAIGLSCALPAYLFATAGRGEPAPQTA